MLQHYGGECFVSIKMTGHHMRRCVKGAKANITFFVVGIVTSYWKVAALILHIAVMVLTVIANAYLQHQA